MAVKLEAPYKLPRHLVPFYQNVITSLPFFFLAFHSLAAMYDQINLAVRPISTFLFYVFFLCIQFATSNVIYMFLYVFTYE